jgi:hypothetical protein
MANCPLKRLTPFGGNISRRTKKGRFDAITTYISKVPTSWIMPLLKNEMSSHRNLEPRCKMATSA